MPTTKTLLVQPADCGTLVELTEYLNFQESREREIVDFGVAEFPSGNANVADYVLNGNVRELPRLTVTKINSANAEAELRAALRMQKAIAYTPALIGGTEIDILIARMGTTQTLSGKMSTFGGPADTGMSPTEGLAIVQEAHFEKFKKYFLPTATKPLGRSLNPDSFYLACRWDRNVTPYSWLREAMVTVRNPISGKSFQAQALDWGPAAWTDRITDLSPGLAKALELKTDDLCEVIIPLPFAPVTTGPMTSGRKPQHEALVTAANRQHSQFSGCDENDEPLLSQIKVYWNEGVKAGSFPDSVETPWSAAFISWCFRQADAKGTDFKFSGRHTDYILPMMQNAKSEKGVFRARKISDYAPKVGDLVHSSRTGDVTSYEDALRVKDYDSHTAIVVGFGEGSKGVFALTIGGNEGDSVRRAEVLLDKDGKVIKRDKSPFIAVVETFIG